MKKITGAAKTVARPRPVPVMYKWIELVDGQPKMRYSNVAPRDLPYETIRQR